MARSFILLDEVSRVLDCSGDQTYALIHGGYLPAIQLGGRDRWRVEVAVLDEFVEQLPNNAAAFDVLRSPPGAQRHGGSSDPDSSRLAAQDQWLPAAVSAPAPTAHLDDRIDGHDELSASVGKAVVAEAVAVFIKAGSAVAVELEHASTRAAASVEQAASEAAERISDAASDARAAREVASALAAESIAEAAATAAAFARAHAISAASRVAAAAVAAAATVAATAAPGAESAAAAFLLKATVAAAADAIAQETVLMAASVAHAVAEAAAHVAATDRAQQLVIEQELSDAATAKRVSAATTADLLAARGTRSAAVALAAREATAAQLLDL